MERHGLADALDPAALAERIDARGAEHGTAAGQDTGDGIEVELADAVLEQAEPAIFDPST